MRPLYQTSSTLTQRDIKADKWAGRQRAAETVVCVCLLVLLLSPAAADASEREPLKGAPPRIVSLAPSITEILFALGAGDSVVGVTTFAKYPPEARLKPKIGGFINPNYEAVAALKPSVVLMLPIHREQMARFSKLGIRTVVTDNRTVADIQEAILRVGEITGKSLEAERLVSRLRKEELAIINKHKPPERPKVMVVVSKQPGVFKNVFVTGGNTIFDDLVRRAGGENVFADSKALYPMVSPEQIVHKNPDIIFQFQMGAPLEERKRTMLTEDWKALSVVSAVRNRKVYLIDEDYASVPGPRYILLLKKFAAFINLEETER